MAPSTSSLGIKQVFKDRGDLRLSEYLYEAEPGSEINILGVALNDLTNAMMRAPIKQKLEQNCKFRILWLNPNSKFGKQRALEENWDYRKWQTNLKSQADALNTLPTLVEPSLRKKLALAQYDAPPTYFIFMTTKTREIWSSFRARSRQLLREHCGTNALEGEPLQPRVKNASM